ncbi:MAG: amidohydrolase family protein [Breznakia sp.]
MEKIIDTHVHVWDLEKMQLPWLESEGYLKQTFLESDYIKSIKSEKFCITDAIYMEVDCAKECKKKENSDAITWCENTQSIFSKAIISADLSSSECRGYIDEYKTKVSGVRQVLHIAEREKGFCLQKQFIENVRYLGEVGLTFDLCLRNSELTDGYELAKACPNTTIVLNHMGNPTMDFFVEPLSEKSAQNKKIWLKNLLKYSTLENVYCKISGIMESDNFTFSDSSKDIDKVLDIFGEDHILYASNYPVLNLGGGLVKWTEFLVALTMSRSSACKEKLFRKNAKKIYFK